MYGEVRIDGNSEYVRHEHSELILEENVDTLRIHGNHNDITIRGRVDTLKIKGKHCEVNIENRVFNLDCPRKFTKVNVNAPVDRIVIGEHGTVNVTSYVEKIKVRGDHVEISALRGDVESITGRSRFLTKRGINEQPKDPMNLEDVDIEEKSSRKIDGEKGDAVDAKYSPPNIDGKPSLIPSFIKSKVETTELYKINNEGDFIVRGENGWEKVKNRQLNEFEHPIEWYISRAKKIVIPSPGKGIVKYTPPEDSSFEELTVHWSATTVEHKYNKTKEVFNLNEENTSDLQPDPKTDIRSVLDKSQNLNSSFPERKEELDDRTYCAVVVSLCLGNIEPDDELIEYLNKAYKIHELYDTAELLYNSVDVNDETHVIKEENLPALSRLSRFEEDELPMTRQELSKILSGIERIY